MAFLNFELDLQFLFSNGNTINEWDSWLIIPTKDAICTIRDVPLHFLCLELEQFKSSNATKESQRGIDSPQSNQNPRRKKGERLV